MEVVAWDNIPKTGERCLHVNLASCPRGEWPNCDKPYERPIDLGGGKDPGFKILIILMLYFLPSRWFHRGRYPSSRLKVIGSNHFHGHHLIRVDSYFCKVITMGIIYIGSVSIRSYIENRYDTHLLNTQKIFKKLYSKYL